MDRLITLAIKKETQSGFCFNQKQMLREKKVMAYREQQSQLPSLSPGNLSQTSTTPYAANLRTEKQRARGSGQGVERKNSRD